MQPVCELCGLVLIAVFKCDQTACSQNSQDAASFTVLFGENKKISSFVAFVLGIFDKVQFVNAKNCFLFVRDRMF